MRTSDPHLPCAVRDRRDRSYRSHDRSHGREDAPASLGRPVIRCYTMLFPQQLRLLVHRDRHGGSRGKHADVKLRTWTWSRATRAPPLSRLAAPTHTPYGAADVGILMFSVPSPYLYYDPAETKIEMNGNGLVLFLSWVPLPLGYRHHRHRSRQREFLGWTTEICPPQPGF